MILGTIGYMAPEQIRAEAVDGRTDLFSLGVLLWEMIRGERPFRAGTPLQVLTAILEAEPQFAGDVETETSTVSPALDSVLRRCLEKRPQLRFQSAGDLAFHLESLVSGSLTTGLQPLPEAGRKQRTSRRTLLAAAVAASLLLAGFLGGFIGRSTKPPRARVVPLLQPLTESGSDRFPSLDANGENAAFVSSRDGRERVWITHLASGEEVPLTDGPDLFPEISPDGSRVLFARGGAIWEQSVLGGDPRRVLAEAATAHWPPHGEELLFTRGAGVNQVGLVQRDGSDERVLWESPNRVPASPAFSPSGRRAAWLTLAPGGNLSESEIVVLDLETAMSRAVAPAAGGAPFGLDWLDETTVVYVQPGSLSPQAREYGLVRHDIDRDVSEVLLRSGRHLGTVSVSPGLRILIGAIERRSDLFELELDVDGAVIGQRRLTRSGDMERQPVYSPDGAWVAYSATAGGDIDLWKISPESGERHRLVQHPSNDWDPAFLPDGSLLWASDRDGHFEIWTADADGQRPRRVSTDGFDAENPTASAGRVLYSSSHPDHSGIWSVGLDGTDPRRHAEGLTGLPEIGPSGARALFVRPLQPTLYSLRLVDLTTGAEETLLEVGGSLGALPGRSRWSPDGRGVYFIAETDEVRMSLFRLRLDVSPRPEPELVFDPLELQGHVESFGISPDGRRITVSVQISQDVILQVEDLELDRPIP